MENTAATVKGKLLSFRFYKSLVYGTIELPDGTTSSPIIGEGRLSEMKDLLELKGMSVTLTQIGEYKGEPKYSVSF